MDQKDLKAIENLLDKKLDEKLDQKLDLNLKPVRESLETNTGTLLRLEKTIGAYSDALDIERKRIDNHETRLAVVEENLPV